MYSHYGPLCTAVYHLTKPTGYSLNGDIGYYAERLEGITGPILEIGVGTGRMFIPLLKQGFNMVGIDQSKEMLSICEEEAKRASFSPTLICDDWTHYTGQETYDAIIIPTSTFCLLPTEEDATRALNQLYRLLAPGGKLILDLDLPFYPEVGEVITSVHPINDTSGITLERKTLAVDWLDQTITTHLTYQKWENGQLTQTELQEMILRWYGLTEFKLRLEAIGFKNISLSADYDFEEEPVDANQTITFEALKISNA